MLALSERKLSPLPLVHSGVKRPVLFLLAGTLLAVPMLAGAGTSAPPAGRPVTGKIKSITLERTPCFGACPVYKVTLYADGTADYVGVRFVPRIGHFKGTFYGGQLERLAPLLQKWGFWNWKPQYEVGVTDQASQIVTVVTDAGTKTVNEYGRSGPDELWALQTMLDGLAAYVRDWKQLPK